MKKKIQLEYWYKFKTYDEIESCYNCPACNQIVDEHRIECKILAMSFALKKDEDFPGNCPMEETAKKFLS